MMKEVKISINVENDAFGLVYCYELSSILEKLALDFKRGKEPKLLSDSNGNVVGGNRIY